MSDNPKLPDKGPQNGLPASTGSGSSEQPEGENMLAVADRLLTATIAMLMMAAAVSALACQHPLLGALAAALSGAACGLRYKQALQRLPAITHMFMGGMLAGLIFLAYVLCEGVGILNLFALIPAFAAGQLVGMYFGVVRNTFWSDK